MVCSTVKNLASHPAASVVILMTCCCTLSAAARSSATITRLAPVAPTQALPTWPCTRRLSIRVQTIPASAMACLRSPRAGPADGPAPRGGRTSGQTSHPLAKRQPNGPCRRASCSYPVSLRSVSETCLTLFLIKKRHISSYRQLHHRGHARPRLAVTRER